MRHSRLRAAFVGAVGLVTCMILCVAPAAAQNAFRSMSPAALLQAWGGAPPLERSLIANALLQQRTAAVPALRSALISGDVDSKLLACAMLGELRDRGSVPALLAATADGSDRVQARAVSALRLIGDPSAAARLRQLVRTTSSRSVLKRAVIALGTVGTSADFGLLRPLLAHPEEPVRVVAAGAMAMLGSIEGQDFLLAAIDGDDPASQKEATFALGYLDTAEAAERLAEILNDPDGRWKSFAVMAQALRARRTQTPAEEAATLEQLALGRDRLASQWALGELGSLPVPEARAALNRLAAREGHVGPLARARLAAVEGQ